jgi:hypothetical protein
MIDTVLSDELVSATEFRNNQKLWLDKASRNPVSLSSGGKRWVVLNREYAGRLHAINRYGQMIIEFCREQQSQEGEPSRVFPWAMHLSENALAEFHVELFSTYDYVARGGDTLVFEEMLDSWAATAEALTNPEVAELLTADIDGEEYTTVE